MSPEVFLAACGFLFALGAAYQRLQSLERRHAALAKEVRECRRQEEPQTPKSEDAAQ